MNIRTQPPGEAQEATLHLPTDIPPSPAVMGRRGFLGRTVAALAAASAANVTAVAATRHRSVVEHPDLVAAGQRLVALQAEHQEADELRIAARAVAEATVPPVPDEIVLRGASILHLACCTDELRDVEGNTVDREIHVIDSQMLTEQIEKGRLHAPKRSKFGKKCRALIATAQKYETERDAAITASDLPTHQARVFWAAFEIKKLAREIAKVEPATMAGVAVLARFQCAYEALEDSHEKRHSALIMGPPLARAVARIA